MSGDTCVMPDGNCSGCDHCCEDESFCAAPETFRDQCDNNCTGCEYCIEGEAFCDLETPQGHIPLCKDCPIRLSLETALDCSECISRYMADMRRYLYRNVACEARKTSDIVKHVPNLPRWS